MKLLVAIQSSENAILLARSTLRWAARAGFNTRVFVPEAQVEEYVKAIQHANYNWRLDLPPSFIVPDTDPAEFARQEGYGLVLLVPDDLFKWDKKFNHEEMVYHYAADVGRARILFAEDKKKMIENFDNGACMVRV